MNSIPVVHLTRKNGEVESEKALRIPFPVRHAGEYRAIEVVSIDPEEVLLPGKYPNRVAARSTLCYFLVRELGMTATAVADRLGMGQPGVSLAVRSGETIVKERGSSLPDTRGK